MSKKNRTRKHKKGGSLTALGTAALLGKVKGIAIGAKSSLKNLGHLGHYIKHAKHAKHSIAAMDDVIIAYAKTRRHGKSNKKSIKNKKELLTEFPELLDVNEIHHSIKYY
jgi:hypothetical protein